MDGFLAFSLRMKEAVHSILGWIASAMLLGLTLFALLEIIRRYIFGVVFEWGQDAIIVGMVAAVACYFGVTQIRRGHLAMSAMMLLPLGLMNLPEATLPVAGLATASALFSMLGNLLLLYAYRRAPATRLAPLVYFQLIAAVLLGLFLFSTLPDALTWAGLAVIITAGITSARLR